jgi:hypothetical protein
LQRTRQRRAGHATAATLDGLGLGAGVKAHQRISSNLSIATAPGIGKKNRDVGKVILFTGIIGYSPWAASASVRCFGSLC